MNANSQRPEQSTAPSPVGAGGSANPYRDALVELPPLPPGLWHCLCTKCMNQWELASDPKTHPPCQKCGYLAFYDKARHTDAALQAYARSAIAHEAARRAAAQGGKVSDKELLEAAARAVGRCLHRSVEDIEPSGYGPTYRCRDCGANPDAAPSWNPLANDGDALRLAVKRSIEVYQGVNDGVPCAHAGYYAGNANTQRQRFMIEPHGDDPCAATRRAIVRAASTATEVKAEPVRNEGGGT